MSLEKTASKTLGDSTSYAVYTDKFDSSLLNPMPRAEGRKDWGITGNEFEGVDIWHCWEASFLLQTGRPVSGVLKFVYDANSEFMVESKSMKLYLNSFDMCQMGPTVDSAIKNYVNQIRTDLTKLLNTNVNVEFFINDGKPNKVTRNLTNFDHTNCLDNIVLEGSTFNTYINKESLLEVSNLTAWGEKWCVDRDGVQRYWTGSVRSRCRVTRQKDTGVGYFTLGYQDPHTNILSPYSLLNHIVSHRDTNEFHELLADKLAKDIVNVGIQEYTIALIYNRRGSLDITPVRWSKYSPRTRQDYRELIDSTYLTQKTFTQ